MDVMHGCYGIAHVEDTITFLLKKLSVIEKQMFGFHASLYKCTENSRG